MRKRELGRLQNDICIEQEIEVDDAWAFGWGSGAVAAHGLFYRQQAAEEFVRRQGCVQQGCCIEEAWLVEVADGVGVMEAGDVRDAAQSFHAVKRFAEVGGGTAEGGWQVGAESNGCDHAWLSAEDNSGMGVLQLDGGGCGRCFYRRAFVAMGKFPGGAVA